MIKDFQEYQSFSGNLLVNNFTNGVSNNGQPYLNINFQDASGNIDGKKWEVLEKDRQLLEIGKIVHVSAEVIKYRNMNQLKVIAINEAKEPIRLEDFLKSAPMSKDYYLEELLKYICQISYPDVRQIVDTIISRNIENISKYPAASRNHHEYHLGLLHHTTSMLKLANSICDIHPNVDRSMLYAGCILHDIGKVVELSGPVVPKYTVEGKLLGHISIVNTMIKSVAEELNINNERVVLLQHMVLSHHGKLEYGSPVLPLTLEAEILTLIDNLDSRINMITKAISDVKEGEFSNHQYGLEGRMIYKPHKDEE